MAKPKKANPTLVIHTEAIRDVLGTYFSREIEESLRAWGDKNGVSVRDYDMDTKAYPDHYLVSSYYTTIENWDKTLKENNLSYHWLQVPDGKFALLERLGKLKLLLDYWLSDLTASTK